jgi:hypothetical protein
LLPQLPEHDPDPLACLQENKILECQAALVSLMIEKQMKHLVSKKLSQLQMPFAATFV